jgi:hypothetical protein
MMIPFHELFLARSMFIYFSYDRGETRINIYLWLEKFQLFDSNSRIFLRVENPKSHFE